MKVLIFTTGVLSLALTALGAPEDSVAIARSIDAETGFPKGLMSINNGLNARGLDARALEKRLDCDRACYLGCGTCSDRACLDSCQANCPICCALHNGDCLSCTTESNCNS